jgi:sugar phosphate isomerase/epimerase
MIALPIGAALQVHDLSTYRDWLLADQRDLEIQDFYNSNLLDEDWQPLLRQAKALLDGYTGRLGIHGPTQGLPLIAFDNRVRRLVQDRLKQALDVCAELGATHMVLHSPFDCFGHPQMQHTWSHGLQEEIDSAHSILDEIVALAAHATAPS